MELIESRIVLETRFKPWQLHFIGDSHVGSLAFDKEALEAKVEQVRSTPDAYWIGMGDYIDAIGYRDKRFDPRDIDPEMRVRDLDDIFNWQARAFLRIVEPIRSRCLGMLTGNHEESVRLYSSTDPVRSLAEWFGVPDLRYAATVRIQVLDQVEARKGAQRYSVIVYCHHGFGGGRKVGGKVNKIVHDVSDLAPANADITAMGHVHDDTAGKKAWLEIPREGDLCIVPRQRVWVLTGSYRKNWHQGATTYNEKSGFPMVNMGSPHVLVKLDTVQCLSGRGRPLKREIPRFQVVGAW